MKTRDGSPVTDQKSMNAAVGFTCCSGEMTRTWTRAGTGTFPLARRTFQPIPASAIARKVRMRWKEGRMRWSMGKPRQGHQHPEEATPKAEVGCTFLQKKCGPAERKALSAIATRGPCRDRLCSRLPQLFSFILLLPPPRICFSLLLFPPSRVLLPIQPHERLSCLIRDYFSPHSLYFDLNVASNKQLLHATAFSLSRSKLLFCLRRQ